MQRMVRVIHLVVFLVWFAPAPEIATDRNNREQPDGCSLCILPYSPFEKGQGDQAGDVLLYNCAKHVVNNAVLLDEKHAVHDALGCLLADSDVLH